jgi:formylglycine-generating enzyme required for sulfatase activity
VRRLCLLLLPGCGWLFSTPEDGGPDLYRSDDETPRPMYKAVVPPPAEMRCDGPKLSSGCFVEVKGGTFLMGAQATDAAAPGYDADAAPDEGPPHEVTVSSFWIQRNEVTASEYALCVENRWCSEEAVTTGGFSNYGDEARRQYPINGVTWEGARRYCEWYGSRLPTEAEWEYAARGTDGRRFPWGDKKMCGVMSASGGGDLRNVEESCELDGTVPMGRLRGNSAFGARGMANNVWEWVSDWYADDAYARHASKNPTGPETGERRVQRGGGWTSIDPVELRSAARGSLKPDEQVNDVGFRCVRAEEEGWF